MNPREMLTAIIELECLRLQFGGMTVNVFLKDGEPLLKTLNIVKQKRRKYGLKGIMKINLIQQVLTTKTICDKS
jgi:hypothetical protein